MIDVVPLSPGGSGVHPTQTFREGSPVMSVRSSGRRARTPGSGGGSGSRPTSMAFGHTPYYSAGGLPSFYE